MDKGLSDIFMQYIKHYKLKENKFSTSLELAVQPSHVTLHSCTVKLYTALFC